MGNKGYHVDPPPKENGDQPLFRVVYSIDVGASDAKQAALSALEMIRAKYTCDPVLVILDSEGKQTTLDLSAIDEFSKITTGFVCQKYRKDGSGKFVCIHQEFIAGDDVHFEDKKGEPIEAPLYQYQLFNMNMLSSDEIIDRLGDVLRRIDVGGEQSRQFAGEIKILDELLRDLGWSKETERL